MCVCVHVCVLCALCAYMCVCVVGGEAFQAKDTAESVQVKVLTASAGGGVGA